MNYTFNIYEAKQIGLHEAIILSNIRFWIQKNKANNKHQYEIEIDEKTELRTFTYNSVKAFGRLFPFLTQKQIRTALQNLRNKNILITGSFNKSAYDRTLWYAFRDEKTLCPPGQINWTSETNQLDQEGQPIPDINTDINTDVYNYTNYTNDSEESLTENKKNNSSPGSNTNIYINYWNLKDNLRTHKPGTKLWQRTAELFDDILSGNFVKKHQLDVIYLRKNNLTLDDLRKKITGSDVKQVIDLFDWLCGPEGPAIKTGYPQSCGSFLFNPKTKTSFFFSLVFKTEEEVKALSSRTTVREPEVGKLYYNEFGINLNNSEREELNKGINFVITQIEDFKKLIDPLPFPSVIRGMQVYRRHVEFLNATCNDKRKNIERMLFRKVWIQFVSWLKKVDDVDLMPDHENLEKRKQYFRDNIRASKAI